MRKFFIYKSKYTNENFWQFSKALPIKTTAAATLKHNKRERESKIAFFNIIENKSAGLDFLSELDFVSVVGGVLCETSFFLS